MRAVVDADLASLEILAVEDHEDTRKLLKMILQFSGASVTAVESGEAALAAIKQLKPDIILCDLCMPYMDGFELIRRIRDLGGERGAVPAIACTALGSEEDIVRTQRSTFQAHLTKPFDPRLLVTTIIDVIHSRQETSSTESSPEN